MVQAVSGLKIRRRVMAVGYLIIKISAAIQIQYLRLVLMFYIITYEIT